MPMTSTAFALNAAIVGDWIEAVPTRFPSPSRKFTHQGGVFAVPDDRVDEPPIGTGIPDAPEGVVADDGLDEVVKRRYVGDRDDEVPDRRSVHDLLHKVCHGFGLLHNLSGGCACCLFPGM